MTEHLKQRRAELKDLPTIIQLLAEDTLGQTREHVSNTIDPNYIKAFHDINTDPNQYLMVVLLDQEIVGTCHLTLMPSLTFTGAKRMHIEAVRIAEVYRGYKIGTWMIVEAIDYAKNNDVKIIQLTTNKQRTQAHQFYESLGFKITHEGMKLYL